MDLEGGRRSGLSSSASSSSLVILFGGELRSHLHLIFENGGQLVSGNQVLVGGQPIGTVDSITLTDDRNADVSITVDEPLHEGTTAVIRATSLSGIANRYVSITPGANNEPDSPTGRRSSAATRHRRRPRPALQHVPAEDAQGAPERHQGPGAALHGQRRGRPPQLQVLRARPCRPGASSWTSSPATSRPSHSSSSPARRSSARSHRAKRPRCADTERQPGAWRDRGREQLAGPLARGAPADSAPGEHDLREPAGDARRPDPAGQRGKAGHEGPDALPAQPPPGL